MKGKKNAPTGHIDIHPEILAELFPSDNGVVVHSFSDADLSAIGRLIAYASAVGGMVTFYRSKSERSQCVSLRIGERQRSLVLGGDDADGVFLSALADGVAKIYLHQQQLANAEELAAEATKSTKRKR